jgi:hypothetical protein
MTGLFIVTAAVTATTVLWTAALLGIDRFIPTFVFALRQERNRPTKVDYLSATPAKRLIHRCK